MNDFNITNKQGKIIGKDALEKALSEIYGKLHLCGVEGVPLEEATNYDIKVGKRALGELYVIYDEKETIVTVEGNNPSGLARLLREKTGFNWDHR